MNQSDIFPVGGRIFYQTVFLLILTVNFGPMSFRTNELSDHWPFGLIGFLTDGLLE